MCRDWEAAASRVDKDVRLALIRIGIVLGKEGGALGTVYSFVHDGVHLVVELQLYRKYVSLIYNMTRFDGLTS